MAVARISAGQQQELYVSNLDARCDWGCAPEYTDAMWRMLQADAPDDYALATGTKYSVGDFECMTFEHAGIGWQRHVRWVLVI